MPTVLDVATFLIQQGGAMTPAKLHKLLYYCQGHHLAWDDEALFSEVLEAWAHGPVCHDLWVQHRHLNQIEPGQLPGLTSELSEEEKDTVLAVLDAYGHLGGHELGVMTQHETPWLVARHAVSPGQRHNQPLDLDVMRQFFAQQIALDEAQSE